MEPNLNVMWAVPGFGGKGKQREEEKKKKTREGRIGDEELENLSRGQ
jgi:hypothetical protein